MSFSAYRYGAPTLPSFARLTSSSHPGSYSMIRAAPRSTYFLLSVFADGPRPARLADGPLRRGRAAPPRHA